MFLRRTDRRYPGAFIPGGGVGKMDRIGKLVAESRATATSPWSHQTLSWVVPWVRRGLEDRDLPT